MSQFQFQNTQNEPLKHSLKKSTPLCCMQATGSFQGPNKIQALKIIKIKDTYK